MIDVYTKMLVPNKGECKSVVKCFKGYRVSDYESVYKNPYNEWYVVDVPTGMAFCKGHTRKEAKANFQKMYDDGIVRHMREKECYKELREDFNNLMAKYNNIF